MRITETAPIDPSARFAQRIKSIEAEVAELQRSLGRATSAWTSYTPTLTQNATVPKTVTYARWRKDDREVTVSLRLDVTGAGTAANEILVGLPPFTPVQGNNQPAGMASVFDATGPNVHPGFVALGTTTFKIFPAYAIGVLALGASAGFNFGLASGDNVCATFTFEATS